MNLKKESVLLRPIELADAELLHGLMNDETERMLTGWSKPVSMYEQMEWIKKIGAEKNKIRYMVCVDNQAVGTVFLSEIDFKNGTAEIHIKLDKQICGKGVGGNALSALLRYAFEDINLSCIYALILSDNVASQKLFEKSGFVKEGIHRNRIYKNGKYCDILSYSILRGEFAGK